MISALQHKSKYKSNSISKFLKKFHIFGFPWCSTREDLSIDVSNTNVGLILIIDEAMVTSFLGVRTDRHGFGILIWKHVGTQKISTQSSKLVVSSDLYMPLRRTGMHNEKTSNNLFEI